MGNARGVFQVGEAHVFSIALGYGHSRKLSRSSVTEAAVRPLFVVLHLPVSNFSACVEQVGEPADPQALFPQPAVEALHMRVLRWLARLDVAQLDLPLQRPGKEMTTGQLRPVVRPQTLRTAILGDHCLQHPRHPTAAQTYVGFQRQTLPRERVDHTQDAHHPPVR